MLKELIIALQSFGKAHRLILNCKLWKWILVPGVFYAVIFVIAFMFFAHTCNGFFAWISAKTGLGYFLSTHANLRWTGFFFTIGSLVLWMNIMLFYFSLFKYCVLLIGSPVFIYLSEKIQSLIEDKPFTWEWRDYGKNLNRAIRLITRNCFCQSIYLLALLLIGLIPIIGLFTPILALLLECFFYGSSMLDLGMQRYGRSLNYSIYYFNEHRGAAIGIGLVFYLLHFLPILGWILAPSYAVIAATYCLYLQHQRSSDHVKKIMLLRNEKRNGVSNSRSNRGRSI